MSITKKCTKLSWCPSIFNHLFLFHNHLALCSSLSVLHGDIIYPWCQVNHGYLGPLGLVHAHVTDFLTGYIIHFNRDIGTFCHRPYHRQLFLGGIGIDANGLGKLLLVYTNGARDVNIVNLQVVGKRTAFKFKFETEIINLQGRGKVKHAYGTL